MTNPVKPPTLPDSYNIISCLIVFVVSHISKSYHIYTTSHVWHTMPGHMYVKCTWNSPVMISSVFVRPL